MLRVLGGLGLLLIVSACASFSTAPEASNQRVRQLCYVQRAPEWVQIAPPQNAQAYRDAWILGADGRAPFRPAYEAPRWPADEFWFRNASGQTKLCTGNPFYRKERCSAGTTMDFTEDANGIVATTYEEPVCVT